jgi:hypothetical protein
MDMMMPPTLLRRTKALQRFKRCLPFVCTLMVAAAPVLGDDWGMGASNSKLPRPDVFAPVSSPAYAIDTLAWFAIAVCTGIALIVGGLLAYSIVRFRSRRGDDDREPPQVYGSNPIGLPGRWSRC